MVPHEVQGVRVPLYKTRTGGGPFRGHENVPEIGEVKEQISRCRKYERPRRGGVRRRETPKPRKRGMDLCLEGGNEPKFQSLGEAAAAGWDLVKSWENPERKGFFTKECKTGERLL